MSHDPFAPTTHNPFHWYAEVFRKAFDFEGRARRREYWWFSFVNLLALIVLYALGAALADGWAALVPVGLYLAVALIPSWAVGIRRLHDTGRSGWWILVQFVPYVGGLILLFMTVVEGTPGTNRYGANPKGYPGVDLTDLEHIFS